MDLSHKLNHTSLCTKLPACTVCSPSESTLIKELLGSYINNKTEAFPSNWSWAAQLWPSRSALFWPISNQGRGLLSVWASSPQAAVVHFGSGAGEGEGRAAWLWDSLTQWKWPAAAPWSCSRQCCFPAMLYYRWAVCTKWKFFLHYTPNWGFLLAFELMPMTVSWHFNFFVLWRIVSISFHWVQDSGNASAIFIKFLNTYHLPVFEVT